MTQRVQFTRQEEEEDRRETQEVSNITQDQEVEEEHIDDDEGVKIERKIWEVTHMSLQELETTKGEVVDFLTELLEIVGWSQVDDKETEKDLS